MCLEVFTWVSILIKSFDEKEGILYLLDGEEVRLSVVLLAPRQGGKVLVSEPLEAKNEVIKLTANGSKNYLIVMINI